MMENFERNHMILSVLTGENVKASKRVIISEIDCNFLSYHLATKVRKLLVSGEPSVSPVPYSTRQCRDTELRASGISCW